MRIFFPILLLLLLTFPSCKKHDGDIIPDYSSIKIKSITLPFNQKVNFLYKGDKINKIGNTNLIYNEKNILIKSKDLEVKNIENIVIQIGSSKNDTIKTIVTDSTLDVKKYINDGQQIVGIIIDTLYNNSYNPFYIKSRKVGLPYANFYFNNHIDSVKYFLNEVPITTRFSYDEKNNIIKEISYEGNFYPGYNLNNFEIKKTFDSGINPFYVLYKQLGVVFPIFEKYDFSPNNPLTSSKAYTINNNVINKTTNYRYIYNNRNLPTEIIISNQYLNQIVEGHIYIEYY